MPWHIFWSMMLGGKFIERSHQNLSFILIYIFSVFFMVRFFLVLLTIWFLILTTLTLVCCFQPLVLLCSWSIHQFIDCIQGDAACHAECWQSASSCCHPFLSFIARSRRRKRSEPYSVRTTWQCGQCQGNYTDGQFDSSFFDIWINLCVYFHFDLIFDVVLSGYFYFCFYS